MRWWRVVEQRCTPRVILVTGFFLFLVYGFPGYMSYDSAWQLNQGRGNEPISDWHPPMMAWVWGKLDALIAGPFLMLVVQGLMFLFGLYLLLLRLMSKRKAAITAVIVLLLPQNLTIMAVIWKDSQMAGFLLAGTALLLSERRHWRVVGYVLLFLATTYRYNAAAPTFPLIIFLFDWKKQLPWLKRYACGAALWVGITASAFIVGAAITEQKAHVWPVGAASVDIYGIIRFSHLSTDKLIKSHPDVLWQHEKDMKQRVRYWYQPTNSYLYAMEGDAGIFQYPQTTEQREALGRLWRELVFRYPGSFLWHRGRVFEAQLRAQAAVWYAFLPDEETGKRLHISPSYSSVQLAWAEGYRDLMHSKIFRPGIYFVLSLLLLPLMRRQRLAFAIVMSGLAHAAGLFALAPAVDYRYAHWMICATIVGAIILFVHRFRGLESTA